MENELVKIVDGDLLDSNEEIIVHQVNAAGVMGKSGNGIARYIRERYPKVYEEYSKLCKSNSPESLMGQVLFVQTEQYLVANLFGQIRAMFNWYATQDVVTDYDAIERGLNTVAEYAKEHNLSHIGFPFKMGAVRGGGDWNKVLQLIEKCLDGFDVTIYRK